MLGGTFRRVWLLVALFLFLAATGCAQPAAGPVSMSDDLGRQVVVKGQVQRVVSLSPSSTEILFALGLDKEIVGVDEFSNYPDAAKSKPKIGGFSTVNIEKVVSLEPDLVLASAGIQAKTTVPALERLGIAVVALEPVTLEGLLRDIAQVGRLMGREKEASRLVAQMESRIEAVKGRVAGSSPSLKPRVLFLTWHDPLWTAGSGILIHDLIEVAGGANIGADLSGHQIISLEAVIARNPEVIIVPTGHGAARDTPLNYVLAEARLKATRALQTVPPRVYQIDADISNRSGPRVVEALEQFARFIHPEVF